MQRRRAVVAFAYAGEFDQRVHAGLAARDEMEDGEVALRVRPKARHPETGALRQPNESFRTVLIGELGDDVVAVAKDKRLLAEMNVLLAARDQMHLDPAHFLVVNRAVRPRGEIEVGAQ